MPDPRQADADPIRPGAAPTFDPVTTGIDARGCIQPAYLQITDSLVSWLRYHFSLASRIEYPALVDRVYLPNDREKSPIQISSLAEWNPKNAGQRPAVLVDRLEQDKDMQNRPIGEAFQGITPGYYGNFMLGQHVIHCLGGREGEAELLAAEVFRDVDRFAPIARQRLNLLRFTCVKVGKRRQMEESREHYSVPVICVYGYQNAWKITPLDEAEITTIRVSTGL